MNVDQLAAAFAEHDADPETVLTVLRTKRRRQIRNRAVTVTGLATATVLAAVVALQPWAPHRTVMTAPPGGTAPSGTTGAPDGANGCAAISLRDTFAMARQGGASVIIATGALTGKTATVDGQTYHEMLLRSVRTLSGPTIGPASTGWIGSGSGPTGPIPGADAGALWAPDGHVLAISWPAQQTGTAIGVLLRVAPIVGDQVIFSTAGCWDTTGLPSQPYHGQLAEAPGSGSYSRAARHDFHAVALATVEQLATG